MLVSLYLLRLLPGQVSFFGDDTATGGLFPVDVEYLCLTMHSDGGLLIVYSFDFGIYGLVACLGSSSVIAESSCLFLGKGD